MRDNEIIYSCEKHIDIALDDFIDKYLEAPEVHISSNNSCSYCKEKAKYKIVSIKIKY